jgi:hypothetical protein
MYYPYLRGRQFELIALREGLEKDIISQSVVPVVEPVKVSSTLFTTIEAYKKADHRIAIVQNPRVGNFFNELANKKELIEQYRKMMTYNCVIPVYIAHEKNDLDTLQKIKELEKDCLVQCVSIDSLSLLSEIAKYISVSEYIVPDGTAIRRRLSGKKILINDHFNKLNKNAAYKDNNDETFSEDHLFYEEEGYSGFSDYSIIGKDYVETGFAPYAVAIHMVYFSENKALRMHHFVSERDEDIADPSGKFGEAVHELMKFTPLKNNITYAYRCFEQLAKAGQYPGLGSVKKLSIMHHIELISLFLDKKI